MVNCPLQDTSKGTVNIALYIESELPIDFNFTVYTKTYIANLAILGSLIYILLNILIIAPEALSFL